MRCKLALCCVLFIVPWVCGQGYRPKEGFVPDSKTAVKIAEAVLIPVYGEKQIASELPFTAKLKNDVWRVEGTLHCPNGDEHCGGGVAMVEISKTDARILSMGHGK